MGIDGYGEKREEEESWSELAYVAGNHVGTTNECCGKSFLTAATIDDQLYATLMLVYTYCKTVSGCCLTKSR